MENQPMFDTSKIVRATGRKPRCLWRLVSWWRRITGRDRYHVGIDYADDGSPDYWCKAVHDTRTGVTTILEMGRGQPPANAALSDAATKGKQT
jgi:hypothetical protein